MAKSKKTVFFCQECGYESPKWLGQCPGCKQWNSFVEESIITSSVKNSGAVIRKKVEPVSLKQITIIIPKFYNFCNKNL